MRRWGLGLAGLLALLLAAFAACEAAGWPFLRGPLERQLARSLQREVSIGDGFALRLLSAIRLRTDRLVVGPVEGPQAPQPAPAGDSPGPGFLDGRGLQLSVPYRTVWGAWRGQPVDSLVVSALEVDRLDARLLRDAQGRANWASPVRKASASEDTGLQLPQFHRLVLRTGHLVLDDALLDLRLDARAATAEGTQAASGAEGAPGAGAPEGGGLRIDGQGRWRGEPFRFEVRSAGVLPLVADENTPVQLTVQAQAGGAAVSFNGRAVDLLRLRGLSGRIELSGRSLSAVGDAIGVTLPTTAPFKLVGQIDKNDLLWSLAVQRLEAGSSRLAGQFRYDPRGRVPLLSGELTGQRLVLADLAPAFGGPTNAKRDGGDDKPNPTDRVLPQRRFDLPSLKAMDADVKVDLARAELGAVFAEQVVPLRGRLLLRDAVLSIEELDARTAGGEIQGRLALDARREVPVWSMDLGWRRVALERWLRPRSPVALKGGAEGEPGPPYVTGRLHGQAQLQGRGVSVAQMLGSLDGSMRAWIQQGQLSHLAVEAMGLDLAQALGLAVVGDELLPLHCAVVRVAARQGVLTPEVAVFDTRDSLVLVGGSVSLAKEALDLTLTVRPKDKSPLSLRTPLDVQGTFAEPKVRPQAGPLGLKVFASLALAAVNPLAGLLPLVDTGSGDQPGCQQALQHMRGGGTAAKPSAPLDAELPPPAAGRPANPPKALPEENPLHRGR